MLESELRYLQNIIQGHICRAYSERQINTKTLYILRVETLPCAADFSATQFKFQRWFKLQNFFETTKENNRSIDHLPIRKRELRRARPIPTALVIVGNPGNPLHLSETSKPH